MVKSDSTQKYRYTAISAVLLFVYASVTFIGALNHEIWFDEAQAWNIARDNDIAGIVGMMKYEGHPPLWHFILFLFSRMGISCDVLPFISWAFMTAAAGLVLFKLPLSLPLKAAVVFSGGFIFTNSVISRSYCLVPLLLCLIAILYQKRKKHPLVFGLLVALLANTHVCFSGMVGILGIFMVIDIIKDWKNSSIRENISGIAGLFIAGIGVLMLVLPLLSSLSTNSVTAERQLNVSQVIKSIAEAPYNVALYGIEVSADANVAVILGTVLVQLSMLGMLVFIRRYRRAFFMQLTFLLVYIITGEVLFYTNANRAAIVLFSFVFVLCIAHGEKISNKPVKNLKADTKLISLLIDTISRLDKKPLRTYELLLTVVMAVTIPSSAMYLIKDYTVQFCPAKKTAEYIEKTLPSDAVYVTHTDSLPQLSAYYPGIKLYSLEYGEFYTYTSHKIAHESIDYDKVKKDLSGYEHIYLIYAGSSENVLSEDGEAFFICDGMKWYANIECIRITPLELSGIENV